VRSIDRPFLESHSTCVPHSATRRGIRTSRPWFRVSWPRDERDLFTGFQERGIAGSETSSVQGLEKSRMRMRGCAART